MVGSAIAPALPGIVAATDFNFSPSLLITLPALGVLIFAPVVGRLINRLGAFKLLALGLIPYAVLGVLGAYLENQYLLVVDRFLLGAATVAIQVSVTALIAQFFSGAYLMKIIAWQGMAIELGGVIFLSIGGMLGEWHWQAPFFIYVLALICLALMYYTLPKKSISEEKVSESTSNTSSSGKVWTIAVASLFAMVLFFVAFVTLPLYLDEIFDFSESTTGYFMAFISFIAILTASQMPKIATKLKAGNTVVLGFVFFTLGYLVFASAAQIYWLVVAAILVGIGFGLTVPLLNHMMLEASTTKTRGKNLGLYSMGIFGGQFLSTFVTFLSADYNTLFYITAILGSFIVLILFFAFRKV